MINLLIASFIFNAPIQKLSFVGNESISSKRLTEEISSKKDDEYNEFNITYDVTRIVNLYKSKGFFTAAVRPEAIETEGGIEVKFHIQEGTRPKIERILIYGVEEKTVRGLVEIEIGDFFLEEKMDLAKKEIADYFRDRGYAFANVAYSTQPDSNLLVFTIEKGTRYYVNKIEVNGLKVCDPAVVHRQIELQKGAIYSKTKLFNSQREIYALGFFGTVNVAMQEQKPDSLNFVFTVRELKSRLLNIGVGFSIPLSFLISFGIEELNLFNMGHRFLVQPSYKVNIEGEWEAKLEGKYSIQHVTPLRLTISLLPFYWIEDKIEFLRITRGAEIRLSKDFSENIQVNIANKYKFIDFRPKVTLPDTFEAQTNSIELQLLMDYRDEFFNPHKGYYILPRVEYAGGFLGGANNFVRFEIEERTFVPLVKSTLAQRLKLGVMLPTDGLEVYEKYYVGGQYSLRGYPEWAVGPDSLGSERYGNILANFNVELRMMLPLNLGVVAFFDAGYIDNELNFSHHEFMKFSAGFGLRYYSLIGPLRADIGFPFTGEDPRFYFGIYHIF